MRWSLKHSYLILGKGLGSLVLVFAMLFAPIGARAQLSIVENVQMDFGSVLDSSGSIILGLNDLITIDPSRIHLGGVTWSGNYMITGTPSTVVQINIISTNANGLTLSDFKTNRGSPPLVGTSLDVNGELELIIGAKMTINSGVAVPGMDQPMAFTLIVNYN